MNIMNKLTLRSLRMNKSRTIVSIIGIMLSVALITTIGCVFTSLAGSALERAVVAFGDCDFSFHGSFDRQAIDDYSQNRSVRDVYYSEELANGVIESPASELVPYFSIISTDSRSMQASRMKLESGRFAEKEGEIVLSSALIRRSGREYHLGDVITVDTGHRYFNEDIAKNLGRQKDEYIDIYANYFRDAEYFKSEGKKTYTVVGILSEENGFLGTIGINGVPTSFVCETPKKAQNVYFRLNDEDEKNFLQVMRELSGLDDDDFNRFIRYNYSGSVMDEDFEALQKKMEGEHGTITYVYINDSLLSAKGIENNHEMMMVLNVAVFLVLIVVAASVFIIRNSFAISITEKTRLYGMLASTGATPRQLFRNIYFEAFCLGIVGIPLGILLGIGVTAGLVGLCSTLLTDIMRQIGQMELMLFVPWYAVVIAAAVGAVTVLISASASAVRASRISPMEAIRSSRDIKKKKKEEKKGYRTPGWVTKLFGIGGSVAWKNMKRSRRQYRATVASIVVSVVLFIAVSSFVDCMVSYIRENGYYDQSEYNISVSIDNYKDEDTYKTIKESEKDIQQLCTYGKINGYRYSFESANGKLAVPLSELTDEAGAELTYVGGYVEDGKLTSDIHFIALDRESFEKLCMDNGMTYEQCKDKGFIKNEVTVYSYDENGREGHKENIRILKKPEGMTLDTVLYEDKSYFDETKTDEDGDPLYVENYVEHKIPVTVAGTAGEGVRYRNREISNNHILVSLEWYEKNIPSSSSEIWVDFDAENPNELEENLKDATSDGAIYVGSIDNIEGRVRMIRSIILIVQIFVYGFIFVVTLIGITNIFNTITTNMKLRQKEFAMLRSVGMTKKEFFRMIHLESVLYTVKSLLIGLPLGVIAGYIIFLIADAGSGRMTYIFPWMALLISIASVLLLLWGIMRFSVAKISRQNIIETIRKDNI